MDIRLSESRGGAGFAFAATGGGHVSGIITDVSLIDAPLREAASTMAEEYAARAIGRIRECAVQGMDELGLSISYTQLPNAAWGNCADAGRGIT
jgi:hypothetical protein